MVSFTCVSLTSAAVSHCAPLFCPVALSLCLQACWSLLTTSALRRRLPAVPASALHFRIVAPAAAATAAATPSSIPFAFRLGQSLWPRFDDEQSEPHSAADHLGETYSTSPSATRVTNAFHVFLLQNLASQDEIMNRLIRAMRNELTIPRTSTSNCLD